MKCDDDYSDFTGILIGKFPLYSNPADRTKSSNYFRVIKSHSEFLEALAGRLLKRLPWYLTRRALVYAHVLFEVYDWSQGEVDPGWVLLACLNFSAKVEELPLAMSALVKEFERLTAEREGRSAREFSPDLSTDALYQHARRCITMVESELMRLLKCDPFFELPYARISAYYNDARKAQECYKNKQESLKRQRSSVSSELSNPKMSSKQKSYPNPYSPTVVNEDLSATAKPGVHGQKKQSDEERVELPLPRVIPSQELKKKAFCFANDVYISRLCLCFSTCEVAATSVYLANRGVDVTRIVQYFKVPRERIVTLVGEVRAFYQMMKSVESVESVLVDSVVLNLQNKVSSASDCNEEIKETNQTQGEDKHCSQLAFKGKGQLSPQDDDLSTNASTILNESY